MPVEAYLCRNVEGPSEWVEVHAGTPLKAARAYLVERVTSELEVDIKVDVKIGSLTRRYRFTVRLMFRDAEAVIG